MTGWIRVLALGTAALVAGWGVLAVAARRLPAGAAREMAGILPNCIGTARRLLRHPAVPRRAKVAVALAVIWCLSPIDLVPELLPVIGPLDDVVVVALALRYAARQVPRAVIEQAWAGERATLARLLGPADGLAAKRSAGSTAGRRR